MVRCGCGVAPAHDAATPRSRVGAYVPPVALRVGWKVELVRPISLGRGR